MRAMVQAGGQAADPAARRHPGSDADHLRPRRLRSRRIPVGASGFLLKTAPAQAARPPVPAPALGNARHPRSRRARLLARVLTNAEIATELVV